MSGLLLIILVSLVFIILFQLGKSSEMVAALQGEEKFDKKRNNIVGYSMLAIFAVFMIGIYLCHEYMMPKMLPESASLQGRKYDSMFVITLWVTGLVFLATQLLTFWFAFRYRSNGTNTAFFFAHSNKLELLWTTVPAIAMAILVAIGLKNWFEMTSQAPKDAQVIEIIGKQFNWISRYPGKDGQLGTRNYKKISDENNLLGLDWTDPKTKDDILIPTGELHLIKDKPVSLIIGSRDVIHDVGLSHFRMKMDAVPGITTTIWFTPCITTAEMKAKTGNPNFVYELSCDQMCGRGHYSMRAVVIVETQAEHDAWIAKQTSYYAQSHPEETPVIKGAVDSAAVNAKKATKL
jgi:cytochrome c oxidase subunit 2